MVIPDINEDLSHIDKILIKHPKEQRYTLAILQDIQKEYKYIPREALNKVSDYLSIPLSKDRKSVV